MNNRKNIRLKNFNYSNPGAYFITICSFEKKHVFGKVKNDEMQLNFLGELIKREWMRSSQIRKNLALDEFVIMPNHIHGIVWVLNQQGNKCFVDPQITNNLIPKVKQEVSTIASFIRSFKSYTSREYNKSLGLLGTSLWQRNYWEHIIRDQISLMNMKEYIKNNPKLWNKDSLNNNQIREMILPYNNQNFEFIL